MTEQAAPQEFSSGSQRAITASMLYSLVTCPHRVTMDVYADPAQRDPVNPFVVAVGENPAEFITARNIDDLMAKC